MAKVTKREKFEKAVGILVMAGEDELAEFMALEAERLARKAGKERKLTAAQKANIALKGEIVETLGDEGMTATQIAEAFEVSVQKVAQLMKQLVEAGEVTRIEGKGKVKTLFVRAGE